MRKMEKKKILVIIAIVGIVSVAFAVASKRGYSKVTAILNHTNYSAGAADHPKKISIVPLGVNLPESFVKKTYQEIRQFLPEIQLASKTGLPASAYYKARGRYRADSLIGWLSRKANPDQVFLGITNVDISTTKGGYNDWGVMGLGFCPGKAAVASNHRLKNKSNFWKVAIHELGHTAGLPHCPASTCFMRDAAGGDPTNDETEFCNKCRVVLVKKGWKL
jgi:archaemetzincin